MTTGVIEQVDIEDELDNDENHFIIYPWFISPPPVGTIVKALCGTLYRTRGVWITHKEVDDRCPDCVKEYRKAMEL